jgi:hypothetical protein
MKTLAITIMGILMAVSGLAAPPFTGGLVLHLDASDATTITGGTDLSSWGDKAGDDNDATAFNGPKWGVKTQNGLNVVTLDGVDDYFSIAGSTGSGTLADWQTGNSYDYSIWIVASTNTGAEWGPTGNDPRGLLSNSGISLNAGSFPEGFDLRWDNDRFEFIICCSGNQPNGNLTASLAGDLNQFYILNVDRGHHPIICGSPCRAASIDGRLISHASSSNIGISNDPILIGAINGAVDNFDGDIAEILIYKSTSSWIAHAPGTPGDIRNDIGAYLAEKWGIANTAYVYEIPDSELQDQIDGLQTLVADLQTQVNDISLSPGPQGPAGTDGSQGPQGKVGATGTAGTDGAAGADADCVACADVANGAIDLACLVLGENMPTSFVQTQAAATVIVNTLLISTNICETACDIGAEIDTLINAKMNP